MSHINGLLACCLNSWIAQTTKPLILNGDGLKLWFNCLEPRMLESRKCGSIFFRPTRSFVLLQSSSVFQGHGIIDDVRENFCTRMGTGCVFEPEWVHEWERESVRVCARLACVWGSVCVTVHMWVRAKEWEKGNRTAPQGLRLNEILREEEPQMKWAVVTKLLRCCGSRKKRKQARQKQDESG